ncbi:hypothetical protein B0T16DRAFT_460791 [Cercophora newfieldiana]|uniref:Uncharacterized protein n=1 Tax=Cercophora newfieldiana TaxID=92897 RepID=A0AA39XUR9_9PEZI|nr:hypothetical protein B0T16DRAFT_460791 [Cercophora newfieldiana]
MAYISFGTTILLGIAQVISPIGLGEVVVSGKLVNATFQYVSDTSVFKSATYDRDTYALSRSCGMSIKPCPGVPSSNYVTGGPGSTQSTFMPTIPQNITECFSSGTSAPGDLRSSLFEIQFRQFATSTGSTHDKVPFKNATGLYSFISKLVQEPGFYLKEGVVIDASNGGIGFRNHTVPVSPPMVDGATWDEDLLWLEPITTCLGTNWTFYSTPQLFPFRGKDSHLAMAYEAWLEHEDHVAMYGHQRPISHGVYYFDQRLQEASDVFSATVRHEYRATDSQTRIGINYHDGNDLMRMLETFDTNDMGGYVFQQPDDPEYLEPARPVWSSPDFTSLLALPIRPCRKYKRNDTASMEIPLVSCYYNIPSALKIDLKDTAAPLKPVPRPISICATGLMATVKRVKFQYNTTAATAGTPSFAGLRVLSVTSIPYANEQDKPLWAVEDPGPDYTLGDISLQWGIIDNVTAEKSAGGIRTVRAESLALPASLDYYNLDGSGWGDSLAGSRAPAFALHTVLRRASYQGGTDLATILRWQNLSSTPHVITNLRWTEVIANMVTGTKSRLSAAAAGSKTNAPASAIGEVYMYHRTVTYRYEFGVAAFLCCVLWLVWMGGCLYHMVYIPRWSKAAKGYFDAPRSLKVAVNTLSVGRLMVWGLDRDDYDGKGKAEDEMAMLAWTGTKEWLGREGGRVVDLTGMGEGKGEEWDWDEGGAWKEEESEGEEKSGE